LVWSETSRTFPSPSTAPSGWLTNANVREDTGEKGTVNLRDEVRDEVETWWSVYAAARTPTISSHAAIASVRSLRNFGADMLWRGKWKRLAIGS
jgi:hypothetical protein